MTEAAQETLRRLVDVLIWGEAAASMAGRAPRGDDYAGPVLAIYEDGVRRDVDDGIAWAVAQIEGGRPLVDVLNALALGVTLHWTEVVGELTGMLGCTLHEIGKMLGKNPGDLLAWASSGSEGA